MNANDALLTALATAQTGSTVPDIAPNAPASAAATSAAEAGMRMICQAGMPPGRAAWTQAGPGSGGYFL